MKILFLNSNIGYGGASKQMVWLANQCADYGHNVTILTFRDKTENQILSDKVLHIHLPLEENFTKTIFHTIRCLHQHIRKHSYDLAIAFLSPSQLRLSLACIGTKTKKLFSQRGDPYQKPLSVSGRIIRLVNDIAFGTAEKYVFQTLNAQKYYSKKIRKKSVIIANPIVPLIRTCPRKGNIEHRIVCVARLDIKQKRQDLLIDAFFLIKNKYPSYTLDFYGNGNDETRLKEKAEGEPRIIFHGKTSDIVSAIQNAAIAVLSSDFEGIPNSLLEYMSLGIPSISTDCSPGGAAFIIKNKTNAILVPANDSKSLSDAISFYIDHPQEAEKIGQRGMEVNNLFSENKIRLMWLDYINS